MSLFSPKITINVSPESFVFASESKTFQLDTYVMVTDATQELPDVLGIGEGEGLRFAEFPNMGKVNLFTNDDHLPVVYGKAKFLKAFLIGGIGHAYPWPRFLKLVSAFRPTVVFRDSETLESVLGGYQQGLLEYLALEAGAGEVLFE
jgi:hypothetical protein